MLVFGQHAFERSAVPAKQPVGAAFAGTKCSFLPRPAEAAAAQISDAASSAIRARQPRIIPGRRRSVQFTHAPRHGAPIFEPSPKGAERTKDSRRYRMHRNSPVSVASAGEVGPGRESIAAPARAFEGAAA